LIESPPFTNATLRKLANKSDMTHKDWTARFQPKVVHSIFGNRRSELW